MGPASVAFVAKVGRDVPSVAGKPGGVHEGGEPVETASVNRVVPSIPMSAVFPVRSRPVWCAVHP